MRKDKPTVEEILEEKENAETVYSNVFREFDEDQRFYELNFLADLALPEEFPDIGICLPTARDMIDANVDHIDVTNARVYVDRKSDYKSDIKKSEAKRKFYNGLIYRTNVEAPISPWRQAAKHYALHGVAYLKTVWDADLWPDKPIQGDESEDTYAKKVEKWRGESEILLPINISAIHPRSVMPDPHHIKPEFFLETHKKACFGIMNRYPKWSNPAGRARNDDVDWIEYWDGSFRCILVDGEPLFRIKGGVVKHNYGFIPYVPIESGLGNLSIDGDFEMRYVGGIRYMKDILIAESRGYSMADYIMKNGAWPWGYLTGENANRVGKIDQRFGAFQVLPEGVEIKTMMPQIPPDALRTWLGVTSSYIDAHAAPRSARGLSEEGVRSGAHERLRLSEATLRFAHSVPAFSHGTARVLINCIRLFKSVIPGDVRLWSRTAGEEFDAVINKDDLEEPFNCDVEFAPISEEDEYRRQDALRMNFQAGVTTKTWTRQQMTNVDAVAMEREEIKEAVKLAILPVIQQMAAQKVQLALTQVQNAQNPPQMGQPQGQPPMGGMTTGVPQRAVPGSAEDLQNQMKQLQRPTPQFPGQGMGGGGARH